jgi:hypothetical protein
VQRPHIVQESKISACHCCSSSMPRLPGQRRAPNQRRQRAGLAQVGAAKRFELVDRRVLRVARGHVEVAGLGAQAAAHAASRCSAAVTPNSRDEAAHGGVDARLVGQGALLVEAGGFCCGNSSAHSLTPRWLKRMPVACRARRRTGRRASACRTGTRSGRRDAQHVQRQHGLVARAQMRRRHQAGDATGRKVNSQEM